MRLVFVSSISFDLRPIATKDAAAAHLKARGPAGGREFYTSAVPLCDFPPDITGPFSERAALGYTVIHHKRCYAARNLSNGTP
jgi:hypothetical protein